MSEGRILGLCVAAIAVVFASVILLSNEDYKDAVEAQSHYCEMVQAWKQSGGQYGWPPFNGECEQ